MTVIQSTNGYTDLNFWQPLRMSTPFYDGLSYDYSRIYETQPNVRTVVDFLSRNVAQLGLHVYKRDETEGRIRLRNHPLSKVLSNPLPPEYKVSGYRLLESLMGDLGVYYNAYWYKIRTQGQVTGLLRIPPSIVTVHGSFAPTDYEINLSSETKHFEPNDIVHFRGYQPGNAIMGLSPIETLRRILAEEQAAGMYREKFWQNAARMGGVIERPATAPEWSEIARARFKSEFESLYSGEANTGKTAVLEEGMQWKPQTFTAEESQYLEGRKLTREECARAYHIPLPMVGILDEATFSSIREQHKMLYTDTLGPWMAMIEADIQVQLLPDFEDSDDVYTEFNVYEKLQGDFMDQAASFQSAVGRPWMTANEARTRVNMPKIENGDELVTPLNVVTGGLASPRDTAPKSDSTIETKATTKEIVVKLEDRENEFTEKWVQLLTKTFNRQRAAILSKFTKAQFMKSADQIDAIFDYTRWDSELANDMTDLTIDNIVVWMEFMAQQAGVELNSGNMDSIRIWAQKNAEISAHYINKSTADSIIESLLEVPDEEKHNAIKKIFEIAIGVRALQLANSRVNVLSNFGIFNAAKLRGGGMTKTWMLGATKKHRESHLKVAGETIPVQDKFGNGLLYPGDTGNAFSAADIANCGCYIKWNMPN